MKQKPRWTLEMFTAGLAVLCLLLAAAVLAAQPAVWPVLLGLVVLWALGFVVFRHHLRRWVARWMCGGKFEKSKLRFSLEPLSQPAALLSGDSILWYNDQFRARLLGGRRSADQPGEQGPAGTGTAALPHAGGAAADFGRVHLGGAQLYRAGRRREHEPFDL